jgi:septum site-determining protein MinD
MAFAVAPIPPIATWLAELDKWCSNRPGFFADKPIVLDLGALLLAVTEIARLIAMLDTRGIRVIGLEGIDHDQHARSLPPVLKGGRPAAGPDAVEPMSAGAPEDDPVPFQRSEPSSLLIESPIRSGQSVIFTYGDVTLLGSVSSGAEIVVGGLIHVYGALRGRVMAGSMGIARARICSTNKPELISVDGYYRAARGSGPKPSRPADPRLARRSRPDDRSLRLRGGGDTIWPRVLVVTYGKGGVGKTRTTAAVGAVLAQAGSERRGDRFRCWAAQSRLGHGSGAPGGLRPDKCSSRGRHTFVSTHTRQTPRDPVFAPDSQTRGKDALTERGVTGVIDEMRERFDWVICDSPAGIECGTTLAMRFADAAPVVINPEVSSVRDSDCIIGLLDSKTERAEKGQRIEAHILITHYDAKTGSALRDAQIDDVIDILSTPLLGNIPESEEVLHASNVGSPVTVHNRWYVPSRRGATVSDDHMPMTVPGTRKACSTSDGEQHEPLEPAPAARHCTSSAGATANPVVSRANGRRQSDLLGILRKNILAAITKHVMVGLNNLQVRMDRGGTVSTLEINVETPHSAGPLLAAG